MRGNRVKLVCCPEREFNVGSRVTTQSPTQKNPKKANMKWHECLHDIEDLVPSHDMGLHDIENPVAEKALAGF